MKNLLSTLAALFGVCVFLGILFIGASLTGWLIMLAVGILFHAGVIGSTIGFWPCVSIGLIFNLLFHGGKKVS